MSDVENSAIDFASDDFDRDDYLDDTFDHDAEWDPDCERDGYTMCGICADDYYLSADGCEDEMKYYYWAADELLEMQQNDLVPVVRQYRKAMNQAETWKDSQIAALIADFNAATDSISDHTRCINYALTEYYVTKTEADAFLKATGIACGLAQAKAERLVQIAFLLNENADIADILKLVA